MELIFDTLKDMIAFLEIGGNNLVCISENNSQVEFTKIIPVLPEIFLNRVKKNDG
jgi:hypothetical protein